MRREHFPDGLIDSCAKATQSQTAIVLVEAKCSEAAVEEAVPAVRIDGTQVERKIPGGGRRLRARHHREKRVCERQGDLDPHRSRCARLNGPPSVPPAQ